jgi:hypothetical protein
MNNVFRSRLVATLMAGAAAVSVCTAAPADAAAPRTISGQVTCVSGRNVVGVWITASNGGSGWAPWKAHSALPSQANYSFRLPAGGSYKVTVGCGGTPQQWASSNHSNVTSGSASFTCYDTPAARFARNFCQRA